MKRISIALFALALCLAIVVVPAATAKKKKKKIFTPAVSLNVSVVEPTAADPNDPYSQPTPGSGHFAGKVISGGHGACTAGRGVTIQRLGGGINLAAKTASDGTYSVNVAARPPAGSYQASVGKTVIKKKNKKTGKVTKITCGAGTSPVVPVT